MMRSASVDFPWSICATIEKLRMLGIGASLLPREIAFALRCGKFYAYHLRVIAGPSRPASEASRGADETRQSMMSFNVLGKSVWITGSRSIIRSLRSRDAAAR
jgi:hypothetical protein